MRTEMAKGAWAHIEAAASERRLFVSDISFWEVSLKAAKGQLTLPTHPTLWLGNASGAPGIQSLPLTRDVLIQSTLLAGEPHADPADRMLIAQAQMSGMSLLTCDVRIIEYAARQSGVPVCDARR
ncbi:MAG: type II toxin-antitoxin system VapC family toxin [Fimbriimonadaceae bacterium]|nr:type II toxin-antitoxin system VapC family toxin [Fimbriimonadaceae bacterium]